MPRTPQHATRAHIAGKRRMPLGLTSAQWAGVPADVRERALFSACVTDARFLEQIRKVAHAVTSGEMGEEQAKGRLAAWLDATGYEPEPGEAGTIKDLSSDQRLHVIVDTNAKLAEGFGRYAWQAERQRLFPFVEMYRAERRMEPRDWPSRWRRAGARAVRGRFLARFGDPVWERISRFGQPYPIFDFNSGMWTRMVTAAQAKRMGARVPETIKPVAVRRRMNDGLMTTSTRRMGKEIGKAVAKHLSGFRLGSDGVLRRVR